MYPNLYAILVGHPGVGKTRTIQAARKFMSTLEQFKIAPSSVTAASLVDFLCDKSKRFIAAYRPGEQAMEYHSCTLLPDDWSHFMPSRDNDLIGALTQFYDVWPYRRTRHVEKLDIIIEKPQLSMLGGTTPSELMQSTPAHAWGQGFMSRTILIYSTERIIGDDFANAKREMPLDMLNDLQVIWGMRGEFTVSKEYQALVNNWRHYGEKPRPNHPRLEHYCTRRRAILYKLSMVHAIDTRGTLVLDDSDFYGAMRWLLEIEDNMDGIFSQARTGDAQQYDEIIAWLRKRGSATQAQLVHKVADIFPNYAVIKTIELLAMSRRIEKSDDGIFTALPDQVL